uniref:DEUBAD domain-containing protein n=1 Tax=Aegilops tauschii subsp. strangulata TaxID=200361 RepID=A0A453MMU6_AEGTS
SKRPRPHIEQPPRSPLLTLSSHIHLRWDDRARRVLPADDQIGIPWRHLAPFLDSPPRAPRTLADVATVPRRIFSLADIPLLGGVLSYQVWDACLTEADRRFLARFLPPGSDAEEAVQDLLTGENHHFGNPLVTWSSALCCGDLHPDAVLNKEQQIRADKKAYHAHLKNYHSDMTDTVTRWRDKWLTCDNPKSLFRG